MTDRTIIIRQGPQRRIIRGGGSTFNPAENQDITGQWTFLLDDGKAFIVSDDPTLVSPTVYFTAFNNPDFAPGYVGAFGNYSASGKACGWAWQQDKTTGAATCTIASAVNSNGTSSDGLTLTDSGFSKRTFVQTISKGILTEYATLSALTTAVSSPEQGMQAHITDIGDVRYDGSAWVSAGDGKTLASVSYNFSYLENVSSNIQTQLNNKAGLVHSGTFATLPAAASYSGSFAWVSDIGITGSLWRSNGTDWQPFSDVPLVESPKYPPFIAPSGTVAAGSSNTITLGTALPFILSDGCWLYLPAVANTNISAGWWFTTMSSTTLGTLKGTAQALPSNSPDTSAFTVTSTGAGTYTGSTSEITAWSVTPATGFLGTRRGMYIECNTGRNSAGTSATTINYKLGGTQFGRTSPAAANQNFKAQASIRNMGTNTQYVQVNASQFVGGSGAFSKLTIDTTASCAVAVTMQTATATDWCGIFDLTMVMRP